MGTAAASIFGTRRCRIGPPDESSVTFAAFAGEPNNDLAQHKSRSNLHCSLVLWYKDSRKLGLYRSSSRSRES